MESLQADQFKQAQIDTLVVSRDNTNMTKFKPVEISVNINFPQAMRLQRLRIDSQKEVPRIIGQIKAALEKCT